MKNSALFTHLDKIQLYVTTQVSRVEGVVDTTGAGKGGGNGGNNCLVRIVKETHWLEVS